MFITSSNRGYTRGGDQRAAGRFLILFSHNSYKWEEQHNRARTELSGQTFAVKTGDGFVVQRTCQCGGTGPCAYKPGKSTPSYYLKYCPVHGEEYKKWDGDGRKLYAYVCHVSMRQIGHFMMGTARALQVTKAYGEDRPGPNDLVVSGTYGGDGLTCDYEDLTEKSRDKLVVVPEELATQFWQGGGHNSAGREAEAMRDWAVKTFLKREVAK